MTRRGRRHYVDDTRLVNLREVRLPVEHFIWARQRLPGVPFARVLEEAQRSPAWKRRAVRLK